MNDGIVELPGDRNRGDGHVRRDRPARGRRGGAARTGARCRAWGRIFRDYDNDGRPDINLTALSGETFPLYRNQGGGAFVERHAVERPGGARRENERLGRRCSSI